MGVMECSRCDNIMCDHLLFGRHYLCGDCWSELLKVKETWPELITPSDAEKRVRAFLETTRGTFDDPIPRDEAFDRIVWRRDT